MIKNRKNRLLACASLLAMSAQIAAAAAPPGALLPNDLNTTTSIKHVVVIYGENRSFDHLFGTYVSASGDKVLNILSEGIINADGSPGPNFNKAQQFKANATTTYSIAPTKSGPYQTLPPPNTDGTPESASDEKPPPFATIDEAAAVDYGLLPNDLHVEARHPIAPHR